MNDLFALIPAGQIKIYVRPFIATGPGSSEPRLGEGKWQISKDGGIFPRWRADGKEIVFHSAADGSPVAVDVSENGTAFQAGVPKQLFTAPAGVGDWDVTADGKRFLMAVPLGAKTADEPITVVLNWQASLRK